MDLDKFVNSKFYGFIDWILRLLIINVLVIILSLLVVPLVPAYVAGFSTIKHFRSNKHGNIFKVFFGKFKQYFLKSFLCGLIILIIGGVFGFGLVYYYDLVTLNNNVFFIFAYGFLFFATLLLLAIYFQLPMIIDNFHFRTFDNLRFGFYVSIRFVSLTLVLFIIWILSGVTFFLILPLWTMIGISGPLFIVDIFSRKYYDLITQQSQNNNFEENEK